MSVNFFEICFLKIPIPQPLVLTLFSIIHNKKTDLEDRFFLNGAGYEVRTHNLDLGKVALCQLS